MPAVLLKWVTIPLVGYHTLRSATRKNFQLFSDSDHVCSSYRDHITLQIPLQQKQLTDAIPSHPFAQSEDCILLIRVPGPFIPILSSLLWTIQTDIASSESETRCTDTLDDRLANRHYTLRIRVPLYTMPGPIEEGQEFVDFAAFKVAMQHWAIGGAHKFAIG